VKLALSLLCDDARPNAEGRLDVHGIFNDLYASGFPARQDRMVLVLVLEWDNGEQGRYAFQVDLLGPDERSVLTVSGHTDVDGRRADRPPPRTRLILPMEGVVFPNPGPHRFVLRVRGREMEGPGLHLVRTDDADSVDPRPSR
jgi:hypothetical protein